MGEQVASCNALQFFSKVLAYEQVRPARTHRTRARHTHSPALQARPATEQVRHPPTHAPQGPPAHDPPSAHAGAQPPPRPSHALLAKARSTGL